MLLSLLFFVAILSQSYADVTGLENHDIYCNDEEKPLNYGKFFGYWYEIAVIPSKERSVDSEKIPCVKPAHFGEIRAANDSIMKIDETSITEFKSVDGNGKSGCYQKVKSWSDPLLIVHIARYINVMMTQFHLVDRTDLMLQFVWESRVPGDYVLVYKRTTDYVTIKEIMLAMELVLKLRGPHLMPQFYTYCS